MQETVTLGIRFIEYLGDVHETVNYAQMAEQAGFDTVWFPHDIFMKNTWVVTSAVAAATTRIKIGNVGTNPYTTNPAEIASYLATLDELSRGRAVIGVGLHTKAMVEWAGVDCTHLLRRTRESVRLIRALLNGEVAISDNEDFHWNEQCSLRFKPLRADVPIYVCAFGEDYLALSGEIGDGSLPMITPPASAGRMVDCIKTGLARRSDGKTDFDIAGCAWLSIAEDGAEAADNMRSMISYFGQYLEAPALAAIGLGLDDFDEIKVLIKAGDYERAKQAVTPAMMKLGLVGTPHQIIAQIEELADQGVTQINLGGPIGPDVKASIALLGAKVIPHFSN